MRSTSRASSARDAGGDPDLARARARRTKPASRSRSMRELAGTLPLLGVCLGHQAIGQAFGGKVVRAPRLMHGKRRRSSTTARASSAGCPSPFAATRYHSLIVERETLPAGLEITAWTAEGEIMGLRHRALADRGRAVPSRVVPDRARPRACSQNFLSRCRTRAGAVRRRDGGRMISELIAQAASTSRDLDAAAHGAAIDAILRGEATPAQIAALLVALRMKGETADELAAAARAMRRHALPVRVTRPAPILDTCGTGGDGSDSFNISTVAAIVVVAACGVHGRQARQPRRDARAAAAPTCSRRSACDLEPRRRERIAQLHRRRSASASCSRPRITPRCGTPGRCARELGVRTMFNWLGPLTNPARATHQLLGVGDAIALEMMARGAGPARHAAARGSCTGTAASTRSRSSGATRVAELRDGTVRELRARARRLRRQRGRRGELRGGDAAAQRRDRARDPRRRARAAARRSGGQRRSGAVRGGRGELAAGSGGARAGAIDSGSGAREARRLGRVRAACGHRTGAMSDMPRADPGAQAARERAPERARAAMAAALRAGAAGAASGTARGCAGDRARCAAAGAARRA